MVVLLLLILGLLLALPCGGPSTGQINASTTSDGSEKLLANLFEVLLCRCEKVELKCLFLLSPRFGAFSCGVGIRYDEIQ
jgi:hypothetical protein